ncbi:hypothetical protein ACFLY7_01240 [Patescibacteria group bacterium]
MEEETLECAKCGECENCLNSKKSDDVNLEENQVDEKEIEGFDSGIEDIENEDTDGDGDEF